MNALINVLKEKVEYYLRDSAIASAQFFFALSRRGDLAERIKRENNYYCHEGELCFGNSRRSRDFVRF